MPYNFNTSIKLVFNLKKPRSEFNKSIKSYAIYYLQQYKLVYTKYYFYKYIKSAKLYFCMTLKIL